MEEALEGPDGFDVARLARIQQVLRLLLAEGVSIRRLDSILEALNDLALREPDADFYHALEYVRRRLARSIASRYRDEDGNLRAAMFDPAAEDALREALVRSETGATNFTLAPSSASALVAALRSASEALREARLEPVALIDGDLRYALHNFASSSGIELAVLSFEESGAATSVSQEVIVDWQGA